MVLMVHEGPAFFVLRFYYESDNPVYSIGPWPAGDVEEITAADDPPVPDALANVLTSSVPIPRDGSLFGWIHGDVVTALVIVYADESESPVPSWAIMPLAGAPEWQWPPFTNERFFGSCFWKHYQAGEVICLGDLVAETPDTVFWVDTKTTIGSDCCGWSANQDSTGNMLRRGCYVYFQALRERKQVPPLEVLAAAVVGSTLLLGTTGRVAKAANRSGRLSRATWPWRYQWVMAASMPYGLRDYFGTHTAGFVIDPHPIAVEIAEDVTVAPVTSAPVKSAPESSAPVKIAPRKQVSLKSAPRRSA